MAYVGVALCYLEVGQPCIRRNDDFTTVQKNCDLATWILPVPQRSMVTLDKSLKPFSSHVVINHVFFMFWMSVLRAQGLVYRSAEHT